LTNVGMKEYSTTKLWTTSLKYPLFKPKRSKWLMI
jgi:hypothetical protein